MCVSDKFDYKSMEQANPVFAPLIFFSFTIIMGFTLISFMLTLIIDGFAVVRDDLANKPNKYELIDFVVGKFKAVIGFGSETMPRMHDRKDQFVEGESSMCEISHIPARILLGVGGNASTALY